jgi:NAD-dependent SIR2 family protein deacetylase
VAAGKVTASFRRGKKMEDAVRRAAELIAQADSLIITAGAGMGIDSGLPDFRGPGGFWAVYPALARSALRFEDIANPLAFATRPRTAWGFYGHRLNLDRATTPHQGFQILCRIADTLPFGAFVFTSNVDGHFAKAGFPEHRIVECHGSIHHLQCSGGCMGHIWPAEDFVPAIDEANCELLSELPTCRRCGCVARPNILMFGDWGWCSDRSERQQQHYRAWRHGVERPLVIELGAGEAIPTARRFGESQLCPLVRINPSDHEVRTSNGIAMACGALAGLQAIEAMLDEWRD